MLRLRKVQDFVRECGGVGGVWYDEGTELQSEVSYMKLEHSKII